MTKNGQVLKKYRLLSELNAVSSNLFSRARSFRNQDYRVRRVNAAICRDIINFYERDDVSRMCPGKKDCITRAKKKKQKRYLLGSLKELHVKFNESSTFKVSYPVFCRFKPFWVIRPKINERETCACKTCTNIECLVIALKKAGAIDRSNAKDMASYICCDVDGISCLQRSCNTCKGSEINYLEFSDETKSVVYDVWKTKREEVVVRNKTKTITHTVKEEIKCTLVEAFDIFETQLLEYMYHLSIYLHQFRAVDRMKRTMYENEALIHCDFSENYSTKYNQEIQSFHFGGSRRQYTIHTVMVYYKKDVYSELRSKAICTLSECNEHSTVSAWVHLQPIFEFIKSECPQTEVLHFLSDSPSTQYRNKTLFYLFAHSLKTVLPNLKTATWNCSAPGHGKGAPDGLGGTLKRSADNVVALGADIGNFQNFVATLQATVRKIQLHVIDGNEIESLKKILPKKIPNFEGTMKVRQVIYSQENPNYLTMKFLSCLTCIQCDKFLIGKLFYNA